MVEDIITSFGDDGDQLTKSKESTGFQKFLFSSLETLDIDVSDYIGKSCVKSHSVVTNLAFTLQEVWR